jgi:hypothetical protein
MHRFILSAPKGIQVDHRDNDGLHNTRGNIRLCTCQQNQGNSRPTTCHTSIFKGVHWDKRDRIWQAKIHINRRSIYLGNFIKEIDAALAYDDAAREYFGEFARLNEHLIEEVKRNGNNPIETNS